MQYNQPADQPGNPNAPYVDGNPGAGIQGSIVPAAGVEFDQREVVEVITRANVRGYSDFSGTACALPANADLTQLRKAIEGFIRSWQYIISTTVTFTVHGPGAYYPDLITAFADLGKYKITPTGHVILQLAGASSGSAQKFTYTQTIVINHPNNDRISIVGAKMLKPLPLDDSGYASNGSSSAQRAADLTTNLAILRSCFATELAFQSIQPLASGNASGLLIQGVMLMHLDAILFTGDAGNCSGLMASCQGYCNGTLLAGNPTISGIAFAQFGAQGVALDAGASIEMQGAGYAQNLWAPVVTIGCNWGFLISDQSFFTTFGNVICLGNNQFGMRINPGCGAQLDGGLFCCSNGSDGLSLVESSGFFCNGPLMGGTAYGPAHFYKNGGYGINVMGTHMLLNLDCGAGGNANVGGSINASWGGIVACTDVNVSTKCSPAWNTIGNGNSLIG
jgi:hypothetical protein